jgi:hypothetical protein
MQRYHVEHKQLIRMVGFNDNVKSLHAELTTSWNKQPHLLCKETCGVYNNSSTSFEAQWNDEIELKML